MKAVFSVSVVLALAGAASASVVDSSPVGLRPAQGPFQMTSGGLRGGTLVYDSSTQTGFRFNPGAAGGTTPADNARVAFDDVPIPDATLMGATSLDVCRLTVGIRRLASAPATDVSVYWSTLTTIVTAPDTNLDLPATLLGTVSLAANGTTTVTELVTFGSSGGPTLFNVPLNLTLFSGFGAFTVGVNLSNTDPSTAGGSRAGRRRTRMCSGSTIRTTAGSPTMSSRPSSAETLPRRSTSSWKGTRFQRPAAPRSSGCWG
jgi:hypothetical protein